MVNKCAPPAMLADRNISLSQNCLCLKLVLCYYILFHVMFYMWLILFFFSYRYSTASESAVIKGTIAKKIPAYVELKKDKTYSWCACGLSKKQVILVIILLFAFFIWLSL